MGHKESSLNHDLNTLLKEDQHKGVLLLAVELGKIFIDFYMSHLMFNLMSQSFIGITIISKLPCHKRLKFG